MNAGLIAAYDAVEIFASATAAYSLTDANNGVITNGSLQTAFCPNVTDVDAFVQIQFLGAVAATTGVQSGSTTVSIPPLGLSESLSYGAFPTASSASVVLADFRLYVKDAAWYCTWSGLTIAIDSTTWNFDAGTFTSARLAPTGIPFLGIPPQLSALAEPQLPPVIGEVDAGSIPFSFAYTASVEVEGGYQVKEVGAGTFGSLPVKVQLFTGAKTGCICDPAEYPTLSALDTGTGKVTGGFVYASHCNNNRGTIVCACPIGTTGDGQSSTPWDTTVDYEYWYANLVLAPDLPKSVQRFAPDFAELVFRGGVPQAKGSWTDTCVDLVAIATTTETATFPVIPRFSSFLATVGNETHVIEAPFGYHTIAPYSYLTQKFYGLATKVVENYNECVVTPPPPEGDGFAPFDPCYPVYNTACSGVAVSRFGLDCDDIVANPDLIPGLYHVDGLARYIDYVANPHWSYAPWFPPTVASGPIQPYEWPVNGNRANPPDYWQPLGTQWLSNPALPPGEGRKTRTDLIAEPLANGGLAGFWSGFFG